MSDSQSHTRKQVLWSILGYAFPALSSLFLTPFVVRGLGEVRYGLFLLCMTTIGFLSVLELGLAGAAVHELARARADEHPETGREVFSTVLALFVVLACVGAATLLIGADVAVERIFKIAEGDRADALICLRLAAAGLFFNLAMVPFVSFIRAAERFDVQSKIGMCVSVFSGLGTFWRGSQGDLIGALLFPLTGSLITATSLAIACRRVDPTRATLTLPSRAVLHDLWRFASFQLLSRICGAVGQEIGKLVLASRYGTGQLTWFSVPFTLMQRVQRLLGTASGI